VPPPGKVPDLKRDGSVGLQLNLLRPALAGLINLAAAEPADPSGQQQSTNDAFANAALPAAPA
jgi:hypothetical protein